MPLAVIYSRASRGIDAPLVTIEVHITNGMPSLSIVGLPETAIKESRDRVRSAIINSGFEFPVHRITINLAPADLPKKEGGRFDLAIALGILAASGQIANSSLDTYEFAGELALDGALRKFNGALPFALETKKTKRKLVVPLENAAEASLPREATILPAKHLLEVCGHLTGNNLLAAFSSSIPQAKENLPYDLSDIRGQSQAKRALEIAAVGQHSLLMIGPPGTGKTMLANRLTSILPSMTEEEALAIAAINSICGKEFNTLDFLQRPFRSPHHTASGVALVGGSNPPRPGEISLAHNGVLFLDELPEFNRSVLEALREPMESGFVCISRASHHVKFPARFQLITAMNPCPCGYLGDNKENCRCSEEQVSRYRARISGPMLDRIDMHVEVGSLPKNLLLQKNVAAETSAEVQKRVVKARTVQLERAGKINAALTNKEIEKYCEISSAEQDFLETIAKERRLSARALHRILKVARSIADLEGAVNLEHQHLAEAVNYRKLK
ncbi:MAG: YifB family Mg chelatase-like AAA ATPase [Gammaproteobacteria bacterium]|nr:YifB family Mg chelatase-like AAA ATPase [Gammaproteobacteria bacterium]